METIACQRLAGERALFKAHDLQITNCVFEDGESPLKEARSLEVDNCVFRWKYPFWYGRSITVRNSLLLEMARAGMWYDTDLAFENCTIEAPKGFRHCTGLRIEHTSIPHADETLWWCSQVALNNVSACGDYFAKNCTDIRAEDFQLVGNYCFDGCRNVEVSRARMLSKDAFWNCENVTVRDSFISGEYIGWNSRNLVFENCTIESLQGLCYIDGLILKNCRLINTTLAFEYCSHIEADITTVVDSVVNPRSGVIRAAGFGQVIQDDPEIDTAQVSLITTAGE